MKRLLQWESSYYNSTELCSVEFSTSEIAIKSNITGQYDGTQFTADYNIRATSAWRTYSFDIRYTFNDKHYTIEAIHQNDRWLVNGELREEFKNCIDIDITLTPLTNSLPINRLVMKNNKPQQITVFYVDVLENTIRPVHQQYTKKSQTEYNFQNVPNDFEADITVDKNGFVTHYPGLFERK